MVNKDPSVSLNVSKSFVYLRWTPKQVLNNNSDESGEISFRIFHPRCARISLNNSCVLKLNFTYICNFIEFLWTDKNGEDFRWKQLIYHFFSFKLLTERNLHFVIRQKHQDTYFISSRDIYSVLFMIRMFLMHMGSWIILF